MKINLSKREFHSSATAFTAIHVSVDMYFGSQTEAIIFYYHHHPCQSANQE